MTEPLTIVDQLNRPLRDLRISVTDRCNFRCVYCMPKEIFGPDFAFLPSAALLSFEEITRLARIFIDHGMRKVRLTGGEPLVRRDIEHLVAMLSALPGLEDIALTTNGSLLARKAAALKEAGLSRVTVSLDSLNNETFQAMNDVAFPVENVLEGIEAASSAGLGPIKVNMVVKRGLNEQDIVPMARYFRDAGHIVRFIEFMDVGHTNGWRMDDVVSAKEIVQRISDVLPLEPVPPTYPGEVANRFRYVDGSGEVGVIASVTQPFCQGCTRARLSSEGKLFTCLFGVHGVDFREALRRGDTDEQIASLVRGTWQTRTDRYSELRSEESTDLPKVEMSYIGG
jgi:cyclic pyranopterin phosphate synthase